MRDVKEYMILDAVTPKAITSSTDATPIVVTKASHGLSTGDRILIFGHVTNVAANGFRKVTRVDANTFSLQNIDSGADIAGSGAGAGGTTGFFMTAPKVPLISDFVNAELHIITTGTSTMTIKVAGSLGKNDGSSPNFGATQATTNPYTYLQIVDLQGHATVDGDTGVVLSGADVNKIYEVNINAMKYLTVYPSAWTAGVLTVKLLLTDNK